MNYEAFYIMPSKNPLVSDLTLLTNDNLTIFVTALRTLFRTIFVPFFLTILELFVFTSAELRNQGNF